MSSLGSNSRDMQKGFTLVETMVAIMVGVIVLTMAVLILFSTQSSGVKILSKREVSENTRLALSRILKDVGSAQSLLRCTVWKSSELQVEYDTYVRRLANGGDDPTTSIVESGSPVFSGSSADCLEYYESGNVLLRVLPNSVCWFKDLTPTNDEIDYSQSFRSACLFRGGSGRDANYDSTGVDAGYSGAVIAPMPCSPESGKALDEDRIYYLECSYNDSNIHYFIPNETVYGSWGLVSGSYREVLDLGVVDSDSTYIRKNIFSFLNSSGATPDFVAGVAGSNTGDILYVNVNMDVLYKTSQKLDDGRDEERTYRYSQTILLQGAKTYKDEGAYSDKFTG